MALEIVFGIAILGLGAVLGLVAMYLTEVRPLQRRYDALVEQMVRMKLQGFVPQFDFTQPKPLDLTSDIREY